MTKTTPLLTGSFLMALTLSGCLVQTTETTGGGASNDEAPASNHVSEQEITDTFHFKQKGGSYDSFDSNYYPEQRDWNPLSSAILTKVLDMARRTAVGENVDISTYENVPAKPIDPKLFKIGSVSCSYAGGGDGWKQDSNHGGGFASNLCRFAYAIVAPVNSQDGRSGYVRVEVSASGRSVSVNQSLVLTAKEAKGDFSAIKNQMLAKRTPNPTESDDEYFAKHVASMTKKMQALETLYANGFSSSDVPSGFDAGKSWTTLTEKVKNTKPYVDEKDKGFPEYAAFSKINGALQLTAFVFRSYPDPRCSRKHFPSLSLPSR